MTTLFKTSRQFVDPHGVLPSSSLTNAEKAIYAIPSLTGWWETDYGLERENGVRWFDRLSRSLIAVLKDAEPPIATAAGHLGIWNGYGNADFISSAGFGSLKVSNEHPLLAVAALTVAMVARAPSSDGIESATQGGTLWASVGPNSMATPKYTLSSANGHANFAAGGVQISNPAPVVDLRDGAWHLHLAEYNGAASTISLEVDQGRTAATQAGANTDLDPSYAGMLSPVLGGDLDNAGSLLSPLYGQYCAFLTFNAVLTAGQKTAVRSYLAPKYGITLV